MTEQLYINDVLKKITPTPSFNMALSTKKQALCFGLLER